MKKETLLLLVVFLAIISGCVTKKGVYDPTKKYSSQQLQQDFTTLENILKTNHPGLYWYASANSVNQYFNATFHSLNDSLTEQQFKNRISWAINKIHCGHTTVRSSKKLSEYLKKRKTPQFPLLLKVWDDSAVVVANLLRNDTIFKPGTIITEINNYTTKQILDSICQFIATDGYSNTFKYQLISFNFPAWFTNIFGSDSSYSVNYIDSTGALKQTMLKNFEGKAAITTKTRVAGTVQSKKQSRRLKLMNYRSLQIDTSLHTAYLSVNTFNNGRLIPFFRQSFRKIKKKNISNLVIDLRLNSGGSVMACTRLSQYLVQAPFHVADTVEAFTRQFPYKRNIKPWFVYWLSMQVSGKKAEDGGIHFAYFEHHVFKPKKKDHFDGRVFLVTGGYTFSAATLLTNNLKGQKNVTVVGEETGGGAYGNSAMFLPTIILPNTGVRVTLPLFRMVLNAKLSKNGRGILPDIEVKPSSNSIKQGIDAKLEKIKQIIKASTTESVAVKTKKSDL